MQRRGQLPVELEIGSEIAGYRIEEIAGRGGMGVVYKATQLNLDRTVALKVLTPELAADSGFRERFSRESRMAASIDHPNVVPVFEAGNADGRLFLAMRFVEGRNLGNLVDEEGPLPPARAIGILGQVAGALDAAHERGLVHRDVKPANILLTRSGARDQAYLTDFGLTKQRTADSGLTKTGQWVGSLDFVAPEQIQGAEVDARTDVYALGAVLYQALTGSPPFDKESEVATMYAHMAEPPPVPSAQVPSLPQAFDSVIASAMAKEPSERYPSAGDLGRAAAEAAEDGRVTPPGEGTIAPSAPPEEFLARPSASPPPTAGEIPHPTTAQPLPPPPPSPPAPPVRAEPSRSGRRGRGGRRFRRRRDHAVEARDPDSRKPVRIPLISGFKFLHGPRDPDAAIPLLGNDVVVESVSQRIAHSDTGSFLISGFRGVGKTTIVRQALSGLDDRDGGLNLIPIFIDVPQPKTKGELLTEMVRRLYEELDRTRVLGRLPPDLQAKLSQTYRRTSLSMREGRAEGIERNQGVSLGPVSGISGQVGRKTTGSSSSEAEFLELKPADLEHEFRSFVRDLKSPPDDEPPPPRGLSRIFGRGRDQSGPWSGQVVVVLDELDKLTNQSEGRETVRELITELKTLLAAGGTHFLFVGGPDLHVEALEDQKRGNSIFESVFKWHAYVPCIWGAEERLLQAVIPDPESNREEVELLRGHLAFWGRGVPGLMMRELNSFVYWDGDSAYLTLAAPDLERIRFFAGLERVVSDFVESHAGLEEASQGSAMDQIEVDQWRLAIYYAVDWILRFRVTFSAEDVNSLAEGKSIDPLLVLSEEEVGDLLEHLEDTGLVRQVTGALAGQTYYGDAPAAQMAAYEVAEDVGQAVAAFAGTPSADSEVAAELKAAFEGHVGESLGDGRYTLVEEIDRSGTGRVYRAQESKGDAEVAIKVFDLPALKENDEMRARFLREGRIALDLDHPHIVKTFDTFDESDGRLAIVMEFVSGESLGHRLKSGPPLGADDAVSVACRVLEALDHINDKGIARLDLRPSSVMVDDALKPVIVNLGLAKYVGEAQADGPTRTGSVLGTPRYAAPEQLAGDPVDIRADLYSLALILYEMIAGTPAREGESLERMIHSALAETIELPKLAVSPQLAEAIEAALARDPEARPADPRAMLDALEATPEGADTPPGGGV